MTQDKELLLKDISARLPYGVIVETPKGKGHVCDINLTIFGTEVGVNINPTIRETFNIEEVKPYLFPLSSMTEEQLKDLGTYYAKDSKVIIDNAIKSLESPLVMYKAAHVCFNTLEWYNKNHFDYRGLIEKGLAIDATNLNIY